MIYSYKNSQFNFHYLDCEILVYMDDKYVLINYWNESLNAFGTNQNDINVKS